MVGCIRRVLLDSMRRWKRESEATLGNATCGVCVHAMHVVCTMHSEANAAFQTQEHNSKNIVHNAHCTVKLIQHSRLRNTAQVALSSLQWLTFNRAFCLPFAYNLYYFFCVPNDKTYPLIGHSRLGTRHAVNVENNIDGSRGKGI